MASSNKNSYTSATLFLSLNLLFFSFIRSADVGATDPTTTTCPIDTSTLGGCAGNLGFTNTCCSLLVGLTDLEVAVCLCAAIKAGILGTFVDVDLALTALLGTCGRTRPSGYVCS